MIIRPNSDQRTIITWSIGFQLNETKPKIRYFSLRRYKPILNLKYSNVYKNRFSVNKGHLVWLKKKKNVLVVLSRWPSFDSKRKQYTRWNIIVFKICKKICEIKLNFNLIYFMHRAIHNVLDIFSQLSTDTIKKGHRHHVNVIKLLLNYCYTVLIIITFKCTHNRLFYILNISIYVSMTASNILYIMEVW